MKLKEYMDLVEPGSEITCWDKDVDSEFYFYTKERVDKPLYGGDFPNVDKCMDRLAEVLDVVKIHDNGVEVNLYEKFEHPEVVRFAKEKFYEEHQYKEDSDVTMLLFDDNVKNISQGFETFSQMMVECLDLVYEPEKSIDNNKINIYGLSIVSSEGYYGGNESEIHIYTSITDCVNDAYEKYLDVWKECEENKIIEEGYECKSKEDFAADFLSSGYVLIQMVDSHIQFEYTRQELELKKEVELDEPQKYQLEGQQDIVLLDNKDLPVQFAVLWGVTMADAKKNKEQYRILQAYDSQELYIMFQDWSNEYLQGKYEDTVEFFTNKVETFLVKPSLADKIQAAEKKFSVQSPEKHSPDKEQSR